MIHSGVILNYFVSEFTNTKVRTLVQWREEPRQPDR